MWASGQPHLQRSTAVCARPEHRRPGADIPNHDPVGQGGSILASRSSRRASGNSEQGGHQCRREDPGHSAFLPHRGGRRRPRRGNPVLDGARVGSIQRPLACESSAGCCHLLRFVAKLPQIDYFARRHLRCQQRLAALCRFQSSSTRLLLLSRERPRVERRRRLALVVHAVSAVIAGRAIACASKRRRAGPTRCCAFGRWGSASRSDLAS